MLVHKNPSGKSNALTVAHAQSAAIALTVLANATKAAIAACCAQKVYLPTTAPTGAITKAKPGNHAMAAGAGVVATPVGHAPMVKRETQAAKAARANWVLSMATIRPARHPHKPIRLRMTTAHLRHHAVRTASNPARNEIGTVMVASAVHVVSAKSVLICASRRKRSSFRPTQGKQQLRFLLPCPHRHLA